MRVLVVGGSGRVGGSTTRWLRRLAEEEGVAGLELAVGGRSRQAYEDFASRWRGKGSAMPVPEFLQVDIKDADSIRSAMDGGWNMVVHTAGPFQGITRPILLQAAIEAKIPYVDVCDDTDLCKVAKGLSGDATAAGVAAVVSAGIWPGVSAMMVREAIDRLGGEVDTVDMSFFTAGTGGAGPTIVSATFLLLAEPPLIYEGGKACRGEAWGDRHLIDFGAGVGERFVHLLDEPEVYTCHRTLGIPNIRSSFGTAPDVWNLMFGVARGLPKSVLKNRDLMQAISVFSMPVISAVDQLVGSTNAMRVDAVAKDGRKVTLRVTHTDLEDCVGLATAAFAMEVLQGRVANGVWFPVEMVGNRAEVFRRVKRGTILWEI